MNTKQSLNEAMIQHQEQQFSEFKNPDGSYKWTEEQLKNYEARWGRRAWS